MPSLRSWNAPDEAVVVMVVEGRFCVVAVFKKRVSRLIREAIAIKKAAARAGLQPGGSEGDEV